MSCPLEAPVCLPPLKRGDTWTQTFAWTQSNGQPVDLSGCHAALQLRKRRVSEPFLDLDSDDGAALIISALAGLVSLRVESEVMATFAPGEYLGDLEVVFPTTPPTTVSSQTFVVFVTEDQTR